MNIKKEFKLKHIVLSLLSSALMLSIVGLLMHIKPNSHKSVGEIILSLNLQTATANAVTSVVTFFRGVDTLGEVTVLFLATTGIALMLSSSQRVHEKVLTQHNFILSTGSKLLLNVIVLFGVYVIIHGHLSPGGGFQGGVIIATAFLLLFLANPNMHLKHSILTFGESISGVAYVLVALYSLFKINILLGNFLPHPIDQIGTLFSGGIIPIIYIIVGIKVGSEMSVIVEYFIKEETQYEVPHA
ncbi:MnhB domain-containing protein [Sulfurospirillum sp. 1612]|uniref:MnhB domain-containing protein n=1 Tax=Sulfurospirillum sp. 1612 TaxID=3094835 RepID=UPI002F91C016